MRAFKAIDLLPSTNADATGDGLELREREDLITLLPVTAGETVALTLNIQTRNPDGTNWHTVATATYNAAGAQAPINLTHFVGQEIRATVTGHTNGSVIVKGYAGGSR